MASRTERLVVEAERRTLRAAEEDGLGDIMYSPLYFFVALWFLVPDIYRLYVVLGAAAAAAGAWRAVEAARRRLTDKRTGYVRLARPKGRDSWRGSVILGLTGGALSAAALLVEWRFPTLPPIQPLVGPVLLYVAIFLAGARKSGLRRHYVLALVPLVSAAIAWPIESERWNDMAIIHASLGIAGLVSGAITLRRYLKTNPSHGAN